MCAVFLDVGGTLVNFEPPHHLQVKKALAEAGIDVATKDIFRAIAKQYGSSTTPNYRGGLTKIDYAWLLRDVGVQPSPSLVSALHGLNQLGSPYSLYEDAMPFIDGVKRKGLRIVLVTNATESMDRILESLGLSKMVDGVVSSYRLGVTKPHPQMFREAEKIVGEPGVHIGDVYEVDYLGATRAGLPAILLDREGFYDDVEARRVSNLRDALPLVDSFTVE